MIRWAGLLLAWAALLLTAPTSFAHPMGNFSVNHYSKIKMGEGSVEILYLVDMAEIPTYQETREFGVEPKPDDPSAARYLDHEEKILRAGLSLDSDGHPVNLELVSRQLTFAQGAGGLPTMKIGFVFQGKVETSAGAHKLSYADNNFPGRTGWKEIVVLSDGSDVVSSSAPDHDRSQELTNYSSDALNSPPQQLSAVINYRGALAADLQIDSTITTSARAAGPAIVGAAHKAAHKKVALVAPGPQAKPASNALAAPTLVAADSHSAAPQNTPRSRFTDLISTQKSLTFWFLFSAALIAAGLGALHALEPGHGKTIVAAYLVGSRGTARHAVLLGVVVTASHTAGVFLLGAVTLYASRYIVPEQLYPWLGAISGLSVAGLGIFISLKHLTGQSGEHSHVAGEKHSHWFLSMFKRNMGGQAVTTESANNSDGTASQPIAKALSLRELCVLGVTGGIVPCPAALVVLLSAFSLHRIGFGLFLITAFSMGLAAVLVIVGLTMVYSKRLMAARMQTSGAAFRYLPLLSSAFMVVLGLGIASSAIGGVHLGQGFLSKDKLIPFVTVILLGLFLGVRHSTDPDHVVAVSTIVSRQGSVKSSAAIGLLWGLGHTLTIFFVGSAIIIFGVVIPPRLGLSMEFCVALMLILLGFLNLTGVMRWVNERLAPMGKGFAASQGPGSLLSSEVGAVKQTIAGRWRDLVNSTVGEFGLYQTLRPLVVGLVHGLAGSAAVALLVLSTIKSPFWATAYLLVFGLGTMVGMMLMTAAISVPMVYTGKRFFDMNRHLTVVSGLASVAFGTFLVYQIGFVDGLFSSHVHWVPQ
jgi:ABC-type nickel/cobalt efflux system permease component RcnA